MTEEELVSGSRSRLAFYQHSLYHRYCDKMMAICYRYAKNRPDAEDMLQEGFIRVFSQIHQYRGEGSLEAWIRKVIVHTCINQLKKNKRFNEFLEISGVYHLHTSPEHVPSIVHAREIVECIRMLPLGYRTVLNLYAIEGYSHREIAGMLLLAVGLACVTFFH